MYPFYGVDSDGQPLTGASECSLRFPPGQLPPGPAFWSLTMYELPETLLVANPLNRYLINSPMLPQLKRDPDGSVTLHLQHESPGSDEEATGCRPPPALQRWRPLATRVASPPELRPLNERFPPSPEGAGADAGKTSASPAPAPRVAQQVAPGVTRGEP